MDAVRRVEEQLLVQRHQAGDAEALALLFERYCEPLRYYLRRILESRDEADDVAQTAWMKALRAIGGLRRTDAFGAWLYRIARNEALQHIRRRRPVESLCDDPSGDEPLDGAEEAFSPEDAAGLHAALGKITPGHREVLVLRFMEDMSYEEIAAVVGCNVGTVRSRVHYAKRAVRSILEDKGHE